MTAVWLEKRTPKAPGWGLVDKHRAQYFILTSWLLILFSTLWFASWLLTEQAHPLLAAASYLYLLLFTVLPLWLLYRCHSLLLSTQVLLTGHFLFYNGLIAVTGFDQSPIVINFFYIPLIALLTGRARIAAAWSVASLASLLIHLLLSRLLAGKMLLLDLTDSYQWFHWNLMGCAVISAVLALAYEKTVRDMSQILAHEKKQFERDMLTDDLTGIANGKHLHHFLEATIFHSGKLGQHIGVVAVDIRQFSRLNGDYGHHTGDQVLQIVAARLENAIRSLDLVARLQADRFVIVLPNIKQRANLDLVVEKIVLQLQEPVITRKHELSLDYRVQSVMYPDDGDSAEVLLEQLLSNQRVEQGFAREEADV